MREDAAIFYGGSGAGGPQGSASQNHQEALEAFYGVE